jgi:hypothetical protein
LFSVRKPKEKSSLFCSLVFLWSDNTNLFMRVLAWCNQMCVLNSITRIDELCQMNSSNGSK